MINSSYHSLHVEIEELRNIFRRNAYPNSFFDECVLRFFNRVTSSHNTKKGGCYDTSFVGSTSWTVKKELTRAFRQILPFSKLKLVLKTSKTLQDFTRLSLFLAFHKLPAALDSHVIYKYTCAITATLAILVVPSTTERNASKNTHMSQDLGEIP